MTDFNKSYYRRVAQELNEFENDPIAKAQQALDWWWENKLAARARARRSEIPERGDYDEMRRFEEELDYQQELADRRFTRGF
jgi:hypothetical protein